MKAKTVNEIRKGLDGSGFGPLKVGHAGMNEAYRTALITSPHISNSETIDYPQMRWASIAPLKELLPKLLESLPSNIIMVGSKGLNDETEAYLHSQVFNDGKYLTKTKILLEWKDSDAYVEATIHTNDIKGASIVEYTTPEDRFVVYFFFRKK